MGKIIIIDDDYALEILVEHLRYKGHNVERISSATEAINKVDTLLTADVVVLDIIMRCPESLRGKSPTGDLNTGMAIYRELRARNKTIPILAYSATRDRNTIDLLSNDKNAKFIPKWSAPAISELSSIIEGLMGIETTAVMPTVFIVHGHNDELKLELKNYLQNTLGLPEPIILHEQPNMGKTIIAKFEKYALQSNIVFVILTPDDTIVDADKSDSEKRRARQNVIFEMGFFMGILGRETGRVFLLYSGPLDLPSDLNGVIYIDISNGIEAIGEQIRRELRHII